ncbi:hypothetical protein PMAYCL1PPCAC_03307 [Pristionchus mayeri]|uniref:Uncharacterized protein n=1 Tax=Pristionchus mayeri TaxID=1317129 RepID=A0AAN4Z230_9BILA|nr:hypothetical protein PMAYCL1PPCAC_03307 [Pristionchus mayeri]
MDRIGSTVRCKGTGKALRLGTGSVSVAKDLKCFPGGSWMAGSETTGIDSREKIEVKECFETECDEYKIRKGEGVTFNKGPPAMLHCEKNQFLVCAYRSSSNIIRLFIHFPACHPGLVTLLGDAKRTIEDEIKCARSSEELR